GFLDSPKQFEAVVEACHFEELQDRGTRAHDRKLSVFAQAPVDADQHPERGRVHKPHQRDVEHEAALPRGELVQEGPPKFRRRREIEIALDCDHTRARVEFAITECKWNVSHRHRPSTDYPALRLPTNRHGVATSWRFHQMRGTSRFRAAANRSYCAPSAWVSCRSSAWIRTASPAPTRSRTATRLSTPPA